MLHAPASGYRNLTTGALTSVGANGYSWSSSAMSASSTEGCRMVFDASRDYPMGNTARAYAFPVRCVQASAIA
ncbi:MAG: hypothetical protein K2G10_01875 [Alistipes sp.]|nr:hypothetical protein [Alistipes sp.]